ncbi:MAG: DEAD/DEAH box helicase [Candidatus Latescibacterota bacterium]
MNTDYFKNLSLNEPILRALNEEGYETPTPVQLAAIPIALEGKDLLATAQTGTGKTAAFALPILHILHKQKEHKGPRPIRALILTPTRELALQIEASFRCYGRHLSLRTAVILGGVPAASQIKALQRNPDILVATPGRLLDLYSQGYIRLGHVEILVLDEADRMLDMGFVTDVRKIVSQLPATRQTLFFSATLSWEIANLASDMLRDPSRVEISPCSSVSHNIEQRVLFVEHENKRDLLTDILKEDHVSRALVFTRTKHRADRITQRLSSHGISADAIHSNKTQGARQRALSAFDQGRIKVLVGTDIVARGIDVDGISHVINYDLPEDPESYVHRIGRTARAGALGIALSFCDAGEVALLQGIEKLTRNPLTADEDHPFHSSFIAGMRDLKLSSSGVPLRKQPRKEPGKPFGRSNRLRANESSRLMKRRGNSTALSVR